MLTFNIKSPLDWNLIEVGEILRYDVYSGTRQIAFDVNTTERTDVFVAHSEDMKDAILVASCDNLFSCAIATASPVFVQFRGPHDAEIFLRGPAASHVVPKTEEPSFAKPMPHGRRNSDLDRIMRIVNLNEQQRNKKLEHTLSEIKAAKTAEQAERAAIKAAEQAANQAAEQTANEAQEATPNETSTNS